MTDDELMDALAAALQENVPSEPPSAAIDRVRSLADAEGGGGGERDAIVPLDGRRHGADTTARDLEPHRRSRFSTRLVAAAAAVIVFAAGAAVGASISRDHPSEGGVVEYAGTITGDGVEGDLEVVKIGIGRVISLDTVDLPILPVSEYYEVWFVAPDDSTESPNRISAGTFHPDDAGRSAVTFAAAVDPAKYPVVEITAEPGDGNPAATGPVVMRAEIDQPDG